MEYQRTIKELLAMEGDAGAIECNRRGLEANAHGDVATALRLFLRARELRPEQPNYALSAANMHIKRGDPRAAISLFDEVLAEPDKLTEKQLHVCSLVLVQSQLVARVVRRGRPAPICLCRWRHSPGFSLSAEPTWPKHGPPRARSARAPPSPVPKSY